MLAFTENLKTKPPQRHNIGQMEIEMALPELPKSRKEAVRKWAEGYVQNREQFGKVFRFAGQMFVAPIGTLCAFVIFKREIEREGGWRRPARIAD